VKYIKDTGIIIGLGIASLLVSGVYYWLLPYLLNVLLIIMPSWKPYFMVIAPAPVVIWISTWLFSVGYYYFMPKLQKIAEVMIVLSLGVGTIQFFYQLFNS
jgi:hypothetical protein